MGFRHTKKGHGQIGRGRRGEGNTYAHIVAWEIVNGPVPEGMYVCHACDNPPCVNPRHLFLGTPADNMRDKVQKGRNLMGENAPWAKLTEGDVKLIRHLAKEGTPQREIGLRFGVSRSLVGMIVQGKRWPHVAST